MQDFRRADSVGSRILAGFYSFVEARETTGVKKSQTDGHGYKCWKSPAIVMTVAPQSNVVAAISGAELFDRMWKLAAALCAYLDPQVFCKAIAETVMACAGSCFPPLDTYDDLHDECTAEASTSSRQKKVNSPRVPYNLCRGFTKYDLIRP